MGFLESCLEPTRGGCVIMGEAGVGKTRLLRELERIWVNRGGLSEFVIGTAAAQPISLGAMAQLVPGTAGVSETHELLHGALSVLEDRAGDRPVALFVDDAQLLDDVSAVLVQLAATQSRIQVFAGLRIGETAPDAIVGLWKDAILPRLDIDPLDEARTLTLLSEAVPNLNSTAAKRLWELSQGNALFLRELVALAADATGPNPPSLTAGVSWSGAVAGRLRELIDVRVGRLTPEQLDALELIGLSEPVPTSLADRLIPPELLEDLERRALITVGGNGRVRTAHPLHGEAIRASMGAIRRRSVLRRLADAVEPGDGVDPIQVAVWRTETGDRDPELFAKAARHALRRLDHQLAEKLARRADGGDELDVGLTLAAALMGQGRSGEADDVLVGLHTTNEGDLVRVSTARGTNLFRGLGRTDEAIALLADVEAKLTDPALLAECRTVRAMLMVILWQAGPALELVLPFVDDAEVPLPARLRAVFVAATVWMHRGLTVNALDLTAEWLERTRAWRAYAPLLEIQLAFVRFYALVLAGRLAEARQYAEADFDLHYAYTPPAVHAVFALARGAVATAQGRHATATKELELASSGLPGGDWFYNQEILRFALLERATLLGGDIEGARRRANERPTSVGRDLVGLLERPLCDAWIDASSGQISKAVETLVSAASRARPDSPLIAAALLREVANLGHADRVASPATALAAEVPHALTTLVSEQIAAAQHADGAALERVARRYEELGLILWAAETYAEASRAYASSGLKGSSLGAGERADRLREVCGQPHTPVLDQARIAATDGQLTRREREIALMAARWSSNAELAERLNLSVHTVHTHLTRIYRKLGIADRSELTDIFGR